MPRGKYTNHKGKGRRFTSVEELEEQRKQDESYRRKKAEPGMESSEEEESAEEGSGSEEGSDSDEGPHKSKGVESLIEVQNPNRKPSKPKKLTEVDEEVAEAAPPQLSRREKEEIEKNKKRAAYNKLHAQGKTAQAKADLARLAIIKQQREDAAKRREAEKLEKEAQKQTKAAEIQKVLGKK